MNIGINNSTIKDISIEGLLERLEKTEHINDLIRSLYNSRKIKKSDLDHIKKLIKELE